MTTGAQERLGHRAARGALVTLVAQGLKILVQLASVVLLARLLTPHDYGLIAMVLAVIGIGEIFRDFGLSSAAIQSPTLSREQRSALFWINGAIGTGLALLVILLAPLVAAFYSQPDLEPIARLLAPVFVANGFATQYRASLVRELRFRSLAIADIGSALVGLASAAGAALLGAGVMALVLQQLAQAACLLLLLTVSSHWLPGLPRRGAPVRQFLGFGGNLVGSQLVGYVANNLDTVIIGLRFGAAPLGIYSRAFQLLMTPLNQIRSPLTSVALPVLSRLADDPQRFNRYVQAGQRALGYSLVAVLALVAAAAESITTVLLGDQWLAAAPVLRLLAIAGIFQTLAFVGYWVYLARGLTRDLLQYSILSAIIRIVILLTASQWGVIGVAVGYAIAPAVSWPISLWWLSRRSGVAVRPLYSGAARILGCAVLGGAASWGAAQGAAPLGPAVQLVAATLALTACYAALVLLPPIRRDAGEVVQLLRQLRSRAA